MSKVTLVFSVQLQQRKPDANAVQRPWLSAGPVMFGNTSDILLRENSFTAGREQSWSNGEMLHSVSAYELFRAFVGYYANAGETLHQETNETFLPMLFSLYWVIFCFQDMTMLPRKISRLSTTTLSVFMRYCLLACKYSDIIFFSCHRKLDK